MYDDLIDIEWRYTGFKAMMMNMAMVRNVWVHIFLGMTWMLGKARQVDRPF